MVDAHHSAAGNETATAASDGNVLKTAKRKADRLGRMALIAAIASLSIALAASSGMAFILIILAGAAVQLSLLVTADRALAAAHRTELERLSHD